MLFKIYTNNYIYQLDKSIANGEFSSLFTDGIFSDTNEDTMEIEVADFDDSNLQLSIDDDHVLENAIKLFETYMFSRTEASNRGLWTYLALHKFANYNKEMFPISQTEKLGNPSKFIYDHYVLGSAPTSMMRHTLCGLWWAVYLSVDEDREDKYELTRILFRQKSFYSRFLGMNLLSLRPALQGILEFIYKNESLFSEHFESRMRVVSIIVNRLAGTKLIPAMDKNYFFLELDKRKKLLEQVTNRDSVKKLI